MKLNVVAFTFCSRMLSVVFLVIISLAAAACGGSSSQSGQQVISPDPPASIQPNDSKLGITVLSGKA